MVRIKVNGDGMVPDGTILEPMYIDDVGGARLSEDDDTMRSNGGKRQRHPLRPLGMNLIITG